jgi:hypothetical protein
MGHAGTIRTATISAVVAIRTSVAFACDPNEGRERCFASAFGRCLTHGNTTFGDVFMPIATLWLLE